MVFLNGAFAAKAKQAENENQRKNNSHASTPALPLICARNITMADDGEGSLPKGTLQTGSDRALT